MGVGSKFAASVATGNLKRKPSTGSASDTPVSDVKGVSTAGNDLTGARVLVVDDGATNRKLIRLLLERRGAKVLMAEDGAIALQMAEQHEFDVILMDMQMPVMDGYTAASELRRSGFTRPIVALTAHAMKGDREKCEQAGCSDYLSKPIDADTLIAKVARLAATHTRAEDLVAAG